jgi:hypothetical protein
MPRVVRKYQVQDFSYLLTPMEEKIQPKEPKKENNANEISDAKRRRDRLMDDQKMRYVLYRNQLHDRDCVRVAKIPDEEFNMCTDIPMSANICPGCFRRVIVRQSLCANMSKYVNLAVRILDRLGASNYDLQVLFCKSKAKLIAIDKENLHFQIGEELWRVHAIENGCRLYHNNYTLLSSETRFFEQGYHLQSVGIVPFYKAVRTMCQYTWEGHLQWAKVKEQAQKKQQLRNVLLTVENLICLSKFSIFYRYYRIVDIDGYLQHRIKSEKLPIRIVKTQGEKPFEQLTIRTRRCYDETVRQLGDSAKERCVQQLCEEYVSACVKES